jgi:hypothetical protein
MRIEETKISDVCEGNIERSKEVLAESIIENVYPLFDEVFNSKVDEVNEKESELKEKRSNVLQVKNELEGLMKKYKKKQLTSKLLDRLEKLISSGLIYDGRARNETIVLLKIIDNLNEEKLKFHYDQALQMINKRFSKS